MSTQPESAPRFPSPPAASHMQKRSVTRFRRLLSFESLLKEATIEKAYVVADGGFVDAVIQPRETREKLIRALAMLETKRDKNPAKKHGNIPL